MNEAKKLVENITEGIQEKKGHGIVIADMTGVEGAICRYFVICQGNSPMQVEAISPMPNGWRWTIATSSCMSSSPRPVPTTTLRVYGKTPA